jgi:DNA polymerase/3'-5' exonuclease PolX
MFNVAFRQRALQKGYTLNEHSMTPCGDIMCASQTHPSPIRKQVPPPPPFHTEQDIFRFLSLQYVEPSKRVGGALRTLIKRPTVVYP